MNSDRNDFFNALRKIRGEQYYEAFKRLSNDVRTAFEEVREERSNRISLAPVTGEDSYTFVLEDRAGIANYALYSLHTDGTIQFRFQIDSLIDDEKGLFDREKLEKQPLRWCRETFGAPRTISFERFPRHYPAFYELLTDCIREFSRDVEGIIGT